MFSYLTMRPNLYQYARRLRERKNRMEKSNMTEERCYTLLREYYAHAAAKKKHNIVDGVLIHGPFAGARVRSVPRQDDKLRQEVAGVQAGVSGLPALLRYRYHGDSYELFWNWFTRLPEAKGSEQSSPEPVPPHP